MSKSPISKFSENLAFAGAWAVCKSIQRPPYLISEPLKGVQTVTVPAGGAVITEFKVDVPGNYTLVDHALARAERGLVGILRVEGQPNAEIFDGKAEPGMH